MTESEKQMLTACRQGNTAAFKTLVETYQEYAYRIAFRILNDADEAGDIVQESFMRVWKHRQQIDEKRKFTTWLFRIITNLCYDHLKSPARRNARLDQSLYENIVSGDNPEKEISEKEIVDRIHTFIHYLTPKQKIVFILRDLENMSIKEVSKITRIRTGAVKTHLYLARRTIRTYLQELGIHHA